MLIQGRPQYKGQAHAPMFKVAPPPYDRLFTTRILPKGYKDEGYTGKGMAFKSIQVIGGALDHDIQNLDLGIFKINGTMVNGKPVIEYAKDVESNAGERSMTVGQGKGQIPIEEWEKAKAQGIPFEEFVASYGGHKVGEEHPIDKTAPSIDAKPTMLKQGLDKELVAKYSSPNTRVYLVNGQYVRDNLDQDYTQGGHWKVYPEFIPKGEVWIDRALDTDEDRKATLLHEIVEMGAMGESRGKDTVYENAHNNIANPAEAKGRANPALLDGMIQEVLDKDGSNMTYNDYYNEYVPEGQTEKDIPQQPSQEPVPQAQTPNPQPIKEQQPKPVTYSKPGYPETMLTPEAKDDIFGLYEDDIMGGSKDMSDILKVTKDDITGHKHLPPQRVDKRRFSIRKPNSEPTLGEARQ